LSGLSQPLAEPEVEREIELFFGAARLRLFAGVSRLEPESAPPLKPQAEGRA